MAENVSRSALMKKIQELSFVKLECELYLDMHPEDTAALSYYTDITPQLAALMDEYQMKYGPIVAKKGNDSAWSWIKEPWPWQFYAEEN